MSIERSEKTENSFPAEELKEWVGNRYPDTNNRYSQELKNAHLKAIDDKNPEGLKKLFRVMFVRRSSLRGEPPEEWGKLDELYRKLGNYLEEER